MKLSKLSKTGVFGEKRRSTMAVGASDEGGEGDDKGEFGLWTALDGLCSWERERIGDSLCGGEHWGATGLMHITIDAIS